MISPSVETSQSKQLLWEAIEAVLAYPLGTIVSFLARQQDAMQRSCMLVIVSLKYDYSCKRKLKSPISYLQILHFYLQISRLALQAQSDKFQVMPGSLIPCEILAVLTASKGFYLSGPMKPHFPLFKNLVRTFHLIGNKNSKNARIHYKRSNKSNLCSRMSRLFTFNSGQLYK